ncbi:hypothetical protein BV898_11605 [Hypsibius exemplaris]|uniref:Uncharacterized protein n=1 Tax=Hypsibius exemplaris TaxID=2072580 RepID=A0A1W0WFY6_HYPEX|nr:hypothetical protein BV898_11605 [Hypsibius exemplaris]
MVHVRLSCFLTRPCRSTRTNVSLVYPNAALACPSLAIREAHLPRGMAIPFAEAQRSVIPHSSGKMRRIPKIPAPPHRLWMTLVLFEYDFAIVLEVGKGLMRSKNPFHQIALSPNLLYPTCLEEFYPKEVVPRRKHFVGPRQLWRDAGNAGTGSFQWDFLKSREVGVLGGPSLVGSVGRGRDIVAFSAMAIALDSSGVCPRESVSLANDASLGRGFYGIMAESAVVPVLGGEFREIGMELRLGIALAPN